MKQLYSSTIISILLFWTTMAYICLPPLADYVGTQIGRHRAGKAVRLPHIRALNDRNDRMVGKI